MKLVARVVDERGRPLASAAVLLLGVDSGTLTPCGKGRVSRGRLTATLVPPQAGWGLLVGGKAMLAPVLGLAGDALDLGEIVQLDRPLPCPVFHAEDGLVHGLPRALLPPAARAGVATRDTLAGATSAAATVGTASLAGTAALPVASTMSFGTMLGSAARQLRGAVVQDEGLTLKSASVNIKGLPTTTEDALALTFPTATELASGAAGLSSLAFQLDPKASTAPPPAPPPDARLPLLLGYTRELALRKLAAAGWPVQVQSEIVADPSQVGRVLRQFPAADTAHPAGALVGLFVGKEAAA